MVHTVLVLNQVSKLVNFCTRIVGPQEIVRGGRQAVEHARLGIYDVRSVVKTEGGKPVWRVCRSIALVGIFCDHIA